MKHCIGHWTFSHEPIQLLCIGFGFEVTSRCRLIRDSTCSEYHHAMPHNSLRTLLSSPQETRTRATGRVLTRIILSTERSRLRALSPSLSDTRIQFKMRLDNLVRIHDGIRRAPLLLPCRILWEILYLALRCPTQVELTR